jgi:hypothetical protein
VLGAPFGHMQGELSPGEQLSGWLSFPVPFGAHDTARPAASAAVQLADSGFQESSNRTSRALRFTDVMSLVLPFLVRVHAVIVGDSGGHNDGESVHAFARNFATSSMKTRASLATQLPARWPTRSCGHDSAAGFALLRLHPVRRAAIECLIRPGPAIALVAR